MFTFYFAFLGRRDDLWSLLYMMIELITGVLPWSKIKKNRNATKNIKQSYIGTPSRLLLKNLPIEFNQFLEHLQSDF